MSDYSGLPSDPPKSRPGYVLAGVGLFLAAWPFAVAASALVAVIVLIFLGLLF